MSAVDEPPLVRATSEGQRRRARLWRGPPPARPPTLIEYAITAIRKAILSGELHSEDRLREEDLADQFGTSRAPVREALRALEHEGLVSYEPHRGVYVTTLSEEEVEEIYCVRAEVEAIAARRVALGIAAAPERLAPYQELLERMRRAVAQGDVAELIAADLAFHRQMLADSGYQFLSRVWASMDGIVRARTSALLEREPEGDLIVYNAESHTPVVAALATGEPEQAAAAIRRHILETRDLWLSRR